MINLINYLYNVVLEGVKVGINSDYRGECVSVENLYKRTYITLTIPGYSVSTKYLKENTLPQDLEKEESWITGYHHIQTLGTLIEYVWREFGGRLDDFIQLYEANRELFKYLREE